MDDSAQDDVNLGSSSSRASSKTYCEEITQPQRLSYQEFKDHLVKSNVNQRNYLDHVLHHIRTSQDNRATSNSLPTFSPFYHYVTGGAGFGKSMLIKVLYGSLNCDRNRDTTFPTVLLTAPTGKAASNIIVQTIHSAFSLPVSQQNSRNG